MRVLVTGATGLIGSELVRVLQARGDEVITMVRRTPANESEREWQPDRGYLQPGTLDGVDAIVNLAGATTGKLPWTKKYKDELIWSRVRSTELLVAAIKTAKKKPKVFVSGSASGFYGDTGSGSAVEDDLRGTGFLADLASEWEDAANQAADSTRVCLVRTTMVFSRSKGALGRIIPLLKLGVAGPLGSGKQWWAWISLPDEVRAILHLIDNKKCSGPYNLTAPQAATCTEVMRSLGKAFKRPTIVPVPAFALRIAFGEGADELLLCNQKLSANRLLESGFEFEHADLDSASAWVAAGL